MIVVSSQVIRASALVVALSIAGVPAASAACELWCGAMMTHQADGCHDNDDARPRAESRHGCTHSPDGVRAFVPTPHERLAPLTAAPGSVPPAVSRHVRRIWHGGAYDRYPPGEAVASRLVLASVLRI